MPKPRSPNHPTFDSRGDSLGWLIAVLSEEMGEALNERLKPYRLTIGEWPTLFALWEKEGITQTELSRACRTRNYTTSRVLDRLEREGWVTRHADPDSRRNRLVYLTPKSKRQLPALLTEADTVNRQVLGRLESEEAHLLQQILASLVRS